MLAWLGAGAAALWFGASRPAWAIWASVAASLAALGLLVGGLTATGTDPRGGLGSTRITLTQIALPVAAGESVSFGGDALRDDIVLAGGTPALAAARVRIGAEDGGLVLIAAPDGRFVGKLGDTLLGATPLGDVRPVSTDATCQGAAQGRRARTYAGPAHALCDAGKRRAIPAGGSAVRTPAGEGMMLVRAGPTVKHAIVAGTSLQLWRLDPPVAVSGLAQPGRLTKVGDYRLDPGLRRIVLTPNDAGARDFARPAEPTSLLLAGAAGGRRPVGDGEAIALFPELGARFEATLAATRIEQRGSSRDRPVLTGEQGVLAGTTLRLGERVSATFRVEVADLASGARGRLAGAATLALILSVIATWRLRAADPLAAVTLGLVDLLLALRLLVATSGALMDPAAATQRLPGDALPLMSAMPLAALLGWPGWTRERSLTAAALAFAAAALAALGEASAQAWITAAGLPLLGAAARRFGRFARWFARPGIVQPMRGLGHRVTGRLGVTPAEGLCLAAAVTLPGARYALAAWSFQEQIVIGGTRVALSLFFVPLTLAAIAPLLAQIARGDAPRRAEPVALGLLLSLGIGLAGIVANDSGFAVIAWPVAVAAMIAWSARRRGPALATEGGLATMIAAMIVAATTLWVSGGGIWLVGVAGAAGALAVAAMSLRPGALTVAPAVAVLALFAAIVVQRPPLEVPAQGTPATLADAEQGRPPEDRAAPRPPSLAAAAAVGVNQARLMAALAPTLLGEPGVRATQQYEGNQRAMLAYAAPGTGVGYLGSPFPVIFRNTHQSDHAAAVHILHPFGRLGGALLAAMLLALPAAALARALERGCAHGWAGMLAALTVALTGVYMLLANLGAAPFTGRNMYLLAPVSHADALEAALLLLILARGLGRAEQPA